MSLPQSSELVVSTLGPCRFPSPLQEHGRQFVDETCRVLVSADARDSEFCLVLGQQAVHAGMAGRTDMVVGFWSQGFTHMPIALAVGQRKQLEPHGLAWQSVLQATGQPTVMVGK